MEIEPSEGLAVRPPLSNPIRSYSSLPTLDGLQHPRFSPPTH